MVTLGSSFSLFSLSTLYFTTLHWSLTTQINNGKGKLSSVEQEFVRRDEKQAPKKHLHARLVMGMIEEKVFWFEIFDSGIFWVGKFWQVFFWVAWFKKGQFLGIQNNLKICVDKKCAAFVLAIFESSRKR